MKLRRRVLELPLGHRPGTVVYSDLGFILCAWICQRAGMAVDELAAPQGFLIPSGADLERCIPTGYDRDQLPLKGRVHDPTCRRAGGEIAVTPAGLEGPRRPPLRCARGLILPAVAPRASRAAAL